MGKPTGFMEYKREDAPAYSVKERIKNFDEFHDPLLIYYSQFRRKLQSLPARL